jgi:sugar O-acyltransferase (sialic acid O-acetyltransferase NeuD family)
MIVLGAGGHAIELLDILVDYYQENQICFFDNTKADSSLLFNKFDVNNKLDYLTSKKYFYLGVGGIEARKKLSAIGLENGLRWKGIRAKGLDQGMFNVIIDRTVDIMKGVQISSNVSIGQGSLINRNASIHHDVKIGEYCELAPGCQLLGKVEIGDSVFVGAGAIILPNVKVADYAVIGAGAVVTKDIASHKTVVGIPSRDI